MHHVKNYNKIYTVVLFFIASTLFFAALASNGATAQPSNFNKL